MNLNPAHQSVKPETVLNALFMLLFTGNIPRGVFCERRSQKTRDILREFMRLVCEANDTPWALHKEVHISCIAKRVAGNGVNSNLFMRAAIENRVI